MAISAQDALRIRKALGLSSKEMGEKMGVSRQAISRYENEGPIPEPMQNLYRLIDQIESFKEYVYSWDEGTREMMEEARSPEGREMYAGTLDTLKNVKQVINQELNGL